MMFLAQRAYLKRHPMLVESPAWKPHPMNRQLGLIESSAALNQLCGASLISLHYNDDYLFLLKLETLLLPTCNAFRNPDLVNKGASLGSVPLNLRR
mmetsp:Transcript_105278/g.157634  ORF Transcript_105278/g.157634 Transcript_105278/m.157634 type:complete len:96 (-) Transcript_105278:54-341(-)